MEKINFFAKDADEVLRILSSRGEGLSSDEAAERLDRYGPNVLPSIYKHGPLIRFLKQFDNLLIYVLLASAVITALMAHWVDSSVIFGVVIINSVIGFIQEGKAEKAMEAIRKLLTFESSVLRNSVRTSIAAEHIVPGDIVLLESGDKIPADMRLIRVKELRIDEAILTGESVPVEKSTEAVPEDALLGDRHSMAFAGTLVTSGQGSGVVVATAGGTEMGKISEMVGTVESLETPLLRKIAQFSKQLTVTILVVSAIVFAMGVFVWAHKSSEMFLVAVGLAVAAIPEGLPAIITITLSVGVHRMARRNAIIRRLPAVETLGSVTVICSDKTGTLTRNEMTVTTVITGGRMFEVSGSGYEPKGEIFEGGKAAQVDKLGQLKELARAGLLCNDSTLRNDNGQWRISGDPTEGSLIPLAIKCGLDVQEVKNKYSRIDVIPFESQHRFMATLNESDEGGRIIYLKGAPETVLELCSKEHKAGQDEQINKDHWNEQIEKIASNGQRSLGVAYKRVDSKLDKISINELQKDMVLLGICGIIDPPREEAIDAVNECKTAGIQVKMITGDHPITAQAIGKQMGIAMERGAITGVHLTEADEQTVLKYAEDVNVFARVSPEHKLILVQALQKQGQIVAMTGDGVNDSPAIKQADVGIAMGIKGTEAAKEASEIVLADDNFASIVHAVAEGRTVYDNIRKSIMFILPTNAGESLVIIIAIGLGYALPITAVQILWVNMITAVTLSMALAFEPPETDVMMRPPQRPSSPILSGLLIWRIIFVSVIMMTGTTGLFLWEIGRDTHIEAARTVAVNTIVMFEFFYLLNARYISRSSLSYEGLFGNKYVLITMGLTILFQIPFTYFGPMQKLFGTVGLGAAEWVRIVAVTFSVFVLMEIEKFITRKSESKANN